MSRLNEGTLEAVVALPRSAGERLAPALTVAGSHARPRAQMAYRGKGRHVGADLGHDLLCRRHSHAGNGVEVSDGASKGRHLLLDLGIKASHRLVQTVYLHEQFAHDKLLRGLKAPFQGAF